MLLDLHKLFILNFFFLIILFCLKPIKTEVFYWPVENESAFSSEMFPVFYCKTAKDGEGIYGLPIYEYNGLVKVCLCSIAQPFD